MKKKILSLLLLSTQIDISSQFININAPARAQLVQIAPQVTRYNPAQGPLQLNDTHNQPGVISKALQSGNLAQEFAQIQNYIQSLPTKSSYSYQEIVEAIRNSYGNQLAIDALDALENVIMYIYNNEAYATHFEYSKWRSFGFNGIRKSWITPTDWLNIKSWTGDNNKKLEQLIDELNQLAHVALSINMTQGLRMKAVVQSYQNWRNGIAALVATYLLINNMQHGSEGILETTVNHVTNDVSTALIYGADLGVQAAQAGLDLAQQGLTTGLNATSELTEAAIDATSNAIANAADAAWNSTCSAVSELKFW